MRIDDRLRIARLQGGFGFAAEGGDVERNERMAQDIVAQRVTGADGFDVAVVAGMFVP